ncbi:MAG: hypothetical protein AAGJ52_08190 [Pseudomonadota bacterium]
MADSSTLLTAFEQGRIEPADFGHRDHLDVAFHLLDRCGFLGALTIYAGTIQTMAQQAGAPEKYNATITCAFLSLIAERKAQSKADEFQVFLDANADLLDSNPLLKWYSADRLFSEQARSRFVLPDRIGSAT